MGSSTRHQHQRRLDPATRNGAGRFRPSCVQLEARRLLASGAITEFPLLSTTAAIGPPVEIIAGPKGDLWFSSPSTNTIGQFTTGGLLGEQIQLPIDDQYQRPDDKPQGLAFNASGTLEVALFGANRIGSIDVYGTSPTLSTVDVGSVDLLNPFEIAVAQDGSSYFTAYAGSAIGKLNASGTAISEYPIPTANSLPFGIATAPDGSVWFTEQQGDKVGHLANGSISEVGLSSTSTPQGIIVAPDGTVWFTEFDGNKIAKLNANGQGLTEYSIPTPNSGPVGITMGGDGNLYFTERKADQIGEFDPTTAQFVEYAIPTPKAAPVGIATGSDGKIWFAESGASNIGRLDPSESPIPTPTILNLAVSTQAATYGQPVRLTASLTTADGSAASGSSGTVSFFAGSVLLGTAPVVAGIATLSDPGNLPYGNDELSASYSGDGTAYSAATTELAADDTPNVLYTGSSTSFLVGMAADGSGGFYTTDTKNNVVVHQRADGSSSLVAPGAGFDDPFAVALDGSGNLFVSDRGNDRVVEVTPSGDVQTVAIPGLEAPGGLTFDSSGDLFVVDSKKGVVWEVKPSGAVSQVVAGLPETFSIAVDASGNLYLPDYSLHEILEASPGGSVSIFSPGTYVYESTGVAVDRQGDLLVGDIVKGTIDIFSPSGALNLYQPEGEPITPTGLSVDSSGTVYVADGGANEVYTIVPGTPLVYSRATPTVSVSVGGQTYNGSADQATATVAGIDGAAGVSLESVSPTLRYYAGSIVGSGLPLSAAPTAAGYYYVTATFAGSTNYGPAQASKAFVITPSSSTVSVSAGSKPYDGNPDPISAMVFGVAGASGSSLDGVGLSFTYYQGASSNGTPLASVPVAAGTYTVVASFPGSANYTPSSAQATYTIFHSTTTVSVSALPKRYDGTPDPVTATLTGATGSPGSTLEGVGVSLTYYAGGSASGTPLAAAPTAAGTYTVVAFFPGSADYLPNVGQATYAIIPASPTVTVSAANKTFDSQPDGVTATIAGVSGIPTSTLEGVGLTFSYYAGPTATGAPLSGAPAGVGTYTVVASFAGSPDYFPSSARATYTISQATPAITWPMPSPIVYGTPLSSTQLDASANVPGSYQYQPAAGTVLHAGAGQKLSVSFTPADATDYVSVMATTSINVLKATPTLTLTQVQATYNGSPFTDPFVITGVNGDSLTNLVSVTYNGSTAAPVNAGTYTVVASFPGTSDYNPVSVTLPLVISPAPTATTLTSSASVAAFNQPVTFTATVAAVPPGGGVPRGSVVFRNGSTVLATVPLPATGPDQATLTWTSLPIDVDSITATYVNSDGNSSGSASQPLAETVLGPGATAVGGTLYVVGNATSDFARITPAGGKLDGSTGLTVSATLDNAYVLKTFVQSFTAIAIYGYNGNDNFQLAPTLTLPTTVVEGNGNDYLQLAGGNDTVTLGTGSDQVFGGNGNKTITASDAAGTSGYISLGVGNETISLGAGNDQVVMGGGTNVVTAGNGNDSVTAGNGTNTILLGNGNEYIYTGTGIDSITLGSGNENVQLGDGNKTVTAGGGNNYVQAGTGTDAITMGNGNENVQLGGGANTVTLGNGSDYVSAGGGNNIVTVGNGNDNTQLGNGNNVVVEGNGNDYVSAGKGANLVVGGLGQHNIQLGGGNNILIDGSATVAPGDSFLAILNAWNGGASAASLRPRLAVTYNTTHPNYLSAGSGRDWFFYTPTSRTTSNKKPTDTWTSS